ncbi:MAG TPA: hypothetical protein VMS40_16170 [Vicinamibacterales bacterium]|nr:hypothetical protein [Vicinamibacterales bacterium]
MISAATTTPARSRVAWMSPRITAWIIASAFVVMLARLWRFLDRYTVNIIYWDQWDFLSGLFDGAGMWALFRWQHGPQRQGIGNLILAVLYPATGWNGRADAAASAVALVLAGLAALWLVKRVCGSLRPWDVVVPLLFLTTTSAETYMVAPNLAHGPLSALLLIGYALALTIPSHGARCLALVVVNFMCVSTGFTWLLGGATPVLLLLLGCAPQLTTRERSMYGASIVASLASLGLFLYGFVPQSATDCFQFPHVRPWEYLPYAGFVLARPFGLIADGETTSLVLGTLAFTAMAAFVGFAAFKLLRSRGSSPFWAVITSLSGFALLFASSSAVGRICLGFDSANASRYIPYVLPGLLALHLVIRKYAPRSPVAYALLPVFLVACIAKEGDKLSANEAAAYFKYKQRWRDCYLSMHDIDACDAWAGHPVYPTPEATRLQQKLDWLEARRYSLFHENGRVAGSR